MQNNSLKNTENDYKYTSSVEEIQKTINNNVIYCLIPRTCRESFAITLPSKINKEDLSNNVKKTLEKSMVNSSIFILSIDKINETDKTTSYNIVFIKIFKELINKLFLAGIKMVHFYVGYSENQNEYPLISDPPEEDKIAKCNKENISLPYKVTMELKN